MFEKIRKMKNQKGFTLVELIVVLVILAILAALLVPALTGYIDKAREQSLTSEASMVLTAAQATVSEEYGKGNVTIKTATSGDTTTYSVELTTNAKKAAAAQINQLSELKNGASWAFTATVVNPTADYKTIKIDKLVYSDGTNAVSYADGKWGATEKKVPTATLSNSMISNTDANAQ